MAKYDPLRDHLLAAGKDSVFMTFAEIGKLVGGLPKSVEKHRPWWGNHNHPGRNVQARAWMEAGYLAEPDIARKTVTFTKARL